MTNKLYRELRELARQEVILELEQKFTKEKDFDSLNKLREVINVQSKN